MQPLRLSAPLSLLLFVACSSDGEGAQTPPPSTSSSNETTAPSSSAPTSPAPSPSQTPTAVQPTPTAVQPTPTAVQPTPTTAPTDISSSGETGLTEPQDSTPAPSSDDTSSAPPDTENPSEPTPSAGCGKGSARPANGKLYVNGSHWFTFPSSYDGTTPLPVLFGFHGCGGGNRGDGTRSEYTDLTQNNVLGQDYVVAVPVSSDSSGCWNYNNDVSRVKAVYDELVNNYCVDTSHVFATGHSSGAQFILQLLQGNHTADAAYLNFRGVAPVAASSYKHSTPMPVMYIQNQLDKERNSSGKDAVDDFVAANKCSSETTPYEGVNSCQSSGTQVNPGCIQYGSCEKPTVWCSHNDPQYNNTGHGVPCFHAQAMDRFFKSL
jgi:polyhydroxybutyrate depolymerase